MKKIDYGQTIAISANLAVVAGILFLGIELQQNNRLLDAQVSYNLLLHRTAARNEVYFNPEFAAFRFKVESGEELSPVEQFRLNTRRGGSLLGYEWEYLQYRSGNLRYLPIHEWSRFMSAEEWKKNTWEPNKNLLSEEFIEFVEGEIQMRK
jgi:hypothetical protein